MNDATHDGTDDRPRHRVRLRAKGGGRSSPELQRGERQVVVVDSRAERIRGLADRGMATVTGEVLVVFGERALIDVFDPDCG